MAVRAMEAGAFDFPGKALSPSRRCSTVIERALKTRALVAGKVAACLHIVETVTPAHG